MKLFKNGHFILLFTIYLVCRYQGYIFILLGKELYDKILLGYIIELYVITFESITILHNSFKTNGKE